MNKSILFISVFCILTTIKAQTFDKRPISFEKKPYSLSAPYNGFDGKPVSMLIKSYYLKDDLKEEDYEGEEYRDISEEERYDILRGKMYATSKYDFDKNGYPTLIEFQELSDKKMKRGKLTVIYKQEIERDENSLATKRIFTQDKKRIEYILEKRDNNVEIYKTKPSKTGQHELIMKYGNDTITCIESDLKQRKTITKIAYNNQGLLMYWGQTHWDGTIKDYFIDYSYRYIVNTSYSEHLKGSDIPKSDEVYQYMSYSIGNNKDDYGPMVTWTRRDKYEGVSAAIDRNPYGFDEQIICY